MLAKRPRQQRGWIGGGAKQPASRGYRVFPAFMIFQQSMYHLVIVGSGVAPVQNSVTSFFCVQVGVEEAVVLAGVRPREFEV